MYGWTRTRCYCLSLPQIDRHCSQVDMRPNMTLIRWLGRLSIPQCHGPGWCRCLCVCAHLNGRGPAFHVFLCCAMIRTGIIVVVAIIPLLAVAVGHRQQMKRTGSILITCHCNEMTKSSSQTAAEPVFLCVLSIDSLNALTCTVAVE